MSLRVFTSGQIQLDNHEIPLWVTQGRHGTIVYTPADKLVPGGKRTEHPMPHKRYTLAYDTSDKPNVAGCLQFEADIRALLAGSVMGIKKMDELDALSETLARILY